MFPARQINTADFIDAHPDKKTSNEQWSPAYSKELLPDSDVEYSQAYFIAVNISLVV